MRWLELRDMMLSTFLHTMQNLNPTELVWTNIKGDVSKDLSYNYKCKKGLCWRVLCKITIQKWLNCCKHIKKSNSHTGGLMHWWKKLETGSLLHEELILILVTMWVTPVLQNETSVMTCLLVPPSFITYTAGLFLSCVITHKMFTCICMCEM